MPSIPSSDEQEASAHRPGVEIEALRLLIDRRRAGPFVGLDEGEADTRAMLRRKTQVRAAQ